MDSTSNWTGDKGLGEDAEAKPDEEPEEASVTEKKSEGRSPGTKGSRDALNGTPRSAASVSAA